MLNASSETTLQYDGSKQFKAVLLNYGDYAFIKVLLDPASLDFFKINLIRISDTLTRTLTWKAFYDMVWFYFKSKQLAKQLFFIFFRSEMVNYQRKSMSIFSLIA